MCFETRYVSGWSGCVVLVLSCSAMADVQQEQMQAGFRRMLEECQLALDKHPGYRLPSPATNDLALCYAEKVRVSFQEARAESSFNFNFHGTYLSVNSFNYGLDRSHLLSAALQAEPRLAVAAYEGALRGYLEPVLAYKTASRSLPQHREQFAQVSIRRGVDPDRLLEATAAGDNNR